jgi:hypothetical protein
MCEDRSQPASLLVVKSVTKLYPSGKKCCKVNNGVVHTHSIEVENQRREKTKVWGTVKTRSVSKQLFFGVGSASSPEWTVDILAYGQRVSSSSKGIIIKNVNSATEDIEADLQYEYDDPFSTGGKPFSITIPVTL